ncbi:MAG: DUF5615 family PIN-like protein [Saprospiraceae bacterium]|nr:DUF5615 family PIN-like protein [Saprospiraceae bacterium]
MFIDNNLPRSLKQCFEGYSVHTVDLGFESLDDISIWKYCKENNLCILTKDQDFEDLSNYYGHPPKVIKLTCGNLKTSDLKAFVNKYNKSMQDFVRDESSSLLILK